MHASIVTLTIIATCSVWAAPAAADEWLPPYRAQVSEGVQTTTFMSAWNRALSAGAGSGQARLFVRPDRREELQARALAQAPGAPAAGAAGIEAAFGPGSYGEFAVARQALERQGLGAEHVALLQGDRAARAWEVPQADDQGVYYSFAQTLSYAHNAGTDVASLYTPEYYQHLRCRAALRVGPLSSHRAWRYWRVCPDAQGRYRPTL